MGARKQPDKKDDGRRLVAKNRKAFFDYEILEKIEAGVALVGTEVKSLRGGGFSFGDGHARFQGEELFLFNVHISEYKQGTHGNHEPLRPRKLLLHRRELTKLQRRIAEKGLTVVPIAVYFNKRGLCKVELGIGRGKRKYDKRRTLADRDMKRQLAQAQKQR